MSPSPAFWTQKFMPNLTTPSYTSPLTVLILSLLKKVSSKVGWSLSSAPLLPLKLISKKDWSWCSVSLLAPTPLASYNLFSPLSLMPRERNTSRVSPDMRPPCLLFWRSPIIREPLLSNLRHWWENTGKTPSKRFVHVSLAPLWFVFVRVILFASLWNNGPLSLDLLSLRAFYFLSHSLQAPFWVQSLLNPQFHFIFLLFWVPSRNLNFFLFVLLSLSSSHSHSCRVPVTRLWSSLPEILLNFGSAKVPHFCLCFLLFLRKVLLDRNVE